MMQLFLVLTFCSLIIAKNNICICFIRFAYYP